MTLNEYQEKAYSTALPNARNSNYMLLGVGNEAGEILGVIKKFYRGDFGEDIMTGKIAKEIGDELWYLAGLAKTLGLNLEVIAQANIDKLADRKARGVLQGDGDNR